MKERRTAILFVDDEPSVTANLRLMLRRMPWDVFEAASGAQGLEILARECVDVVVSDERMPGMTGSEFLARVAREAPDVVRIILSGQASLDAAIAAINEAGIFRFLQKPCAREDLIACLEAAVLAGERAREARIQAEARRVDECRAAAFDEALDLLWMAVQPIGRPSRREVFGFEALARCEHESFPHPGALFDTAEGLGRVFELEARIRSHVAELLPRIPEQAFLLVNLHPASLEDPDLFAEDNPLFRLPERVVLEITERASLGHVLDVGERIDSLRERGFQIALDDLGAGYAGLNSLTQLRPDIVKLDMELIRDLDSVPTKARVVESIVRLGSELGFQIIAEGIETVSEFRAAGRLGCDLVQGFLLGRPGKPLPSVEWPVDEDDG